MLHITFPENLPVSERRAEIEDALRASQVLILCGETGSGKTTQLPKIVLGLKQAKAAREAKEHSGKPRPARASSQRPKIIAHTQPRRIAASSVAKRIADELHTPLGEVVGFKVRFADKLSKNTQIKLMTDGILLAETQTDPDLLAYDCIIIDEAHERSLNIDFLLGYLRQLLPRRPDLTVIVTSATIDAERFAKHFASIHGPAPVMTVSGRIFPVEQRYRPFEESRDFDVNDAMADALDELWRNPSDQGDVLIFLPGEREIREAADHLRKHLAHSPVLRSAEVLPLFARLTPAEQDKIFSPHSTRRVVLATNVAETSLTVPGIRYVIDTGTARVKRYSYRHKVEQLLVEPISQAAANQRAGRCGRVANGICIRLYSEQDFAGRAPFTDPEILRSSLAGVILRMKALHLADDQRGVEDFPFLEAPSGRAIADGYQLLSELGAVDESNAITPLGMQLAKLPLDPRLGRMLLEAKERGALDEVLVIASAISVQDVRDRPMDKQTQADQAHVKFDDEKSEFVGYLKLWKWLEEQTGSRRQIDSALKANFISARRVREWRDLYSQLQLAVKEHLGARAGNWGQSPIIALQHSGAAPNFQPATFEALHMSLMAGLLGNIGCKSDEEDWYLGARGIKFYPHPGRNLSKKPGRWIMCSELVETTRLFGRGIANIDPQWIEKVAHHLLRRQLLDPHWEKKAGQVMALERATLYGLVVYHNRRVDFSKIDPSGAREVFIREALVAGNWATPLPFLQANINMIAKVEDLEHKSRRQDVLVDDELIFAFYDQHIPQDVCSGHTFERWFKQTVKTNPKLLLLSREELMRHEAAGITTDQFPKIIRLGGVDCKATYLHDPSHAADGLTVEIPIFALNQVSEDRCEWLVPGMLKDKIGALLKSLPQRPRSRFVPLPASSERLAGVLCEPMNWASGSLTEVLLKRVRDETSLDIKRNDFKLDMLLPHHFMNFRVVDEHGRQLGTGRNLVALKAELGSQARGAFQALAGLKGLGRSDTVAELVTPPHSAASTQNANAATQRHTTWSFGELPELMEIQNGKQSLIGFPALIDAGDAVTIEVFDEPDVAQAKHREGLRRLVALQMKDAIKYLEKNLPDFLTMTALYMPLGTADELKTHLINLALDRAFLIDPLPSDEQAFKRRVEEGRGRLTLIAGEVSRMVGRVLLEYAAALRKIKDNKAATEPVADIQQQLQKLMNKGFVMQTPYAQLQHLPRYLKAIVMRLDKWRADPARDAAKLAELRPLEQRYVRRVIEQKGQMDARLEEYRWLLEELRVSFFAQELRTPQPVSSKRLDKAWSILCA
ncbi:MAG: ATP-dependent RNA helicase HrpA [Cytophagales bacterium]|nr:ATP-dependent RNA helicase HrpA [Cytophagales bacterium]